MAMLNNQMVQNHIICCRYLAMHFQITLLCVFFVQRSSFCYCPVTFAEFCRCFIRINVCWWSHPFLQVNFLPILDTFRCSQSWHWKMRHWCATDSFLCPIQKTSKKTGSFQPRLMTPQGSAPACVVRPRLFGSLAPRESIVWTWTMGQMLVSQCPICSGYFWYLIHWIGLRENLQETMVFPIIQFYDWWGKWMFWLGYGWVSWPQSSDLPLFMPSFRLGASAANATDTVQLKKGPLVKLRHRSWGGRHRST